MWRLDLSPWIWTYGRGSSSSISYCSLLSSCIIEVLLHSFLSRTPECFDSFLCQWRLTPIHHYHNTSTHHQQNQTQRKQNRLRDFNHPEAIITHRHVMQQSVVTTSIGLGPACHVFPSSTNLGTNLTERPADSWTIQPSKSPWWVLYMKIQIHKTAAENYGEVRSNRSQRFHKTQSCNSCMQQQQASCNNYSSW